MSDPVLARPCSLEAASPRSVFRSRSASRSGLGLMCILQVLLAISCNGPTGLMAGGGIDGEARPAPSDWAFAGDAGLAVLETKPEEPYSVNLAYTVFDGVLYVNAGGTETQWVKNMESDPRVRLRIEDAIYELRAERVTDRAEIEAFAKAWLDQSFFRRDPLGYDEVWIYRLGAR